MALFVGRVVGYVGPGSVKGKKGKRKCDTVADVLRFKGNGEDLMNLGREE